MNTFKKLIALFAMMIALMASTAPCFADELNAQGQLNIDSITVGSTTYTNVLINLGTGWNVVSIGSSCTAPKVLTNGVCATPTTLPAGYVSQGGLTWMPVSATTYTYAQATALCAGTINGQTGWRLPTLAELSGLTAPPTGSVTAAGGDLNTTATGGLYGSGAMNGQGWTLSVVWSSTPDGLGNHYIVGLNNGTAGVYFGNVDFGSNTSILNVTCVR